MTTSIVPPDPGSGGSSGAPVDAEYTTGSENATLTNERVWVDGDNTTVNVATDSEISIDVTTGAGGFTTAGTGLTSSGVTVNAIGTADRITANADSLDIASTYVGQTSITTLGTVTTGTWSAIDVAVAAGGTGASDAPTARSNLSAAVTGANNDITSMTAVTGALQAPTQINDSSGNEVLKFGSTGTAVNEVTITNKATGTGPTVEATGGDTNINLNLVSKGSGVVQANGGALYSVGGTDVAIADGGTGQSTANAGFNALAPSQTDKANHLLTSNGTDTSWDFDFPGTPVLTTGGGTVNLTVTSATTQLFSTAAVAYNLPEITSAVIGKVFIFQSRNDDASKTSTINAYSGETVFGASTIVFNDVAAPFGAITIKAIDASTWYVINLSRGVYNLAYPQFFVNKLSVAQGGTGVETLGDAGVLIGNGTSAVNVSSAGTAGQVFTSNGAGVDPTFQAAPGLVFGGSGARQAPETGTLTGEYWHTGDWNTSGAITANRCRIHVLGNVVIDQAITVGTEQAGGITAASIGGGMGQGLGGGTTNFSLSTGGGGGANGGNGGNGGSGIADRPAGGGRAYFLENHLGGSSGAGGTGDATNAGGAGGAAGGGFYLEASGTITVATGGTITASGAAGSAATGSAGGGGGGSGGTIDVRAAGTITISNNVTWTASGGAGGAGASTGGGGGGGGGGNISVKSGTITETGTLTLIVAGGAAGANGTLAATAGATGVSDKTAQLYSVRSAT